MSQVSDCLVRGVGFGEPLQKATHLSLERSGWLLHVLVLELERFCA